MKKATKITIIIIIVIVVAAVALFMSGFFNRFCEDLNFEECDNSRFCKSTIIQTGGCELDEFGETVCWDGAEFISCNLFTSK